MDGGTKLPESVEILRAMVLGTRAELAELRTAKAEADATNERLDALVKRLEGTRSKRRTRTQGDAGEPIALSILQAAELVGVGRTSIYEALRQGRLKKCKFGRRSLILRSELERFCTSLSEEG